MADCNIEKTVTKEKSGIPYTYDLTIKELRQLYDISREDIFHALIVAFQFGFIRGARAKAKNRVPTL